MGIALICSGLGLALLGAYIGSTMPLVQMCKLAAGWGGGSTEEWHSFDRLVLKKQLASTVLLVLGTALQVIGSLWS